MVGSVPLLLHSLSQGVLILKLVVHTVAALSAGSTPGSSPRSSSSVRSIWYLGFLPMAAKSTSDRVLRVR